MLTIPFTILPTPKGQVTVTVVRIHQMRIQNELVSISTRLFSYFQHGSFDPSPFFCCFNMLLIQMELSPVPSACPAIREVSALC